jgi:hypothetical protein
VLNCECLILLLLVAQTGLRHSGKPSSFLVACLDGRLYNDYGENKFLTLCKVNGGSTAYKELNRLLLVRNAAMIKEENNIPEKYIHLLIFSSTSIITYRRQGIKRLPETAPSNTGSGFDWKRITEKVYPTFCLLETARNHRRVKCGKASHQRVRAGDSIRKTTLTFGLIQRTPRF